MSPFAAYAVGLSAVVLAGFGAVWAAQSVGDILSAPSVRARQRARKLGADIAVTSEEYGRARLLLQMVAMSSAGWPEKVARAISPYAAMVDKSGTQLDSRRIGQAGLTGVVTAADVLRARSWIGLVTGIVLAVMVLFSEPAMAIVFLLLGFVLGVRLPSFTLARAAEDRRRGCIRALPEMIDMISLASRAGMGFDAALSAYVERFDTPLAREFKVAFERWSVGALTRDEALDQLSATLEVDVVTRFISAVEQALRLGSPLARVLEEQAEDARKSQKMALEELIAKAPVKIFLPMGLLILPAMLILMLGPVMLEVARGLQGF